jgi:glycosyltransferase involved in cell wall biosynthesis
VDRIEVVHNGIDVGPPVTAADVVCARKQLGIAGDGPVLGTAARLDAVKDLATLLRALVPLKQRWPAIRLVVIGDGAERDRLASLCRELGLEKNVMFAGHRDDARSLFPAFDVYVNSSISEGISLTLLEAMAASRAIVATRVGGTPEVVDHETTGLLVPARSADEMSTAVEQLLGSPSRRVSMGAAGRSRVERLFSVERMVAHYADIYERAQRS